MSKLATIGRLRNLEDVLKGENEMYRAEVCYTAANELEAAEATIKAIEGEVRQMMGAAEYIIEYGSEEEGKILKHWSIRLSQALVEDSA